MRDDAADRLLCDFLEAVGDADSERHLAALLDDVAKPVIRRVVSSALRDSPADIDDVVSDTLVHLLRHLRELRRAPSDRIDDFRGYVAACAYHSCHQRLREKHPARNRLRNHIQYLLRHDFELALWRAGDGRMVGGLRRWTGQQAARSESAAQLRLVARCDRTAEDRVQTALLVREVFLTTGRPLELEQLVNVIARSIGLEQERVGVVAGVDIAAREDSAETNVDLRLSLRELWQDVAVLSQRQRTALLLNLRDGTGVEVLSLVIDTRTATIDEIAVSLEMPVAQLTAIWSDLPLSDAVIARMLAVSPQQVIKFRRLARERLRRLAKRREQPSTIAPSFSLTRFAARRMTSVG